MKKVMLILVLVMVGNVWGAWGAWPSWSADEEVEVSRPEIKVGQVWKRAFSGDKRKVFEVGEKYVVFGFVGGGDKDYPSVEPREDFLEDYELVEDVEDECCEAIVDGPIELEAKVINVTSTLAITVKPQKPYLYKNLNNEHWICSVHGDLTPNDSQLYFNTFVIVEDIRYCSKCYWEIQVKLLSKHIIGIKEQ